MDDESKKFLHTIDPKRAAQMDKGIEREELIERYREVVQDAGELALQVFADDTASNAFYVHCQNMILRLDESEAAG